VCPRGELRRTVSLMLEYLCGPTSGVHETLKAPIPDK